MISIGRVEEGIKLLNDERFILEKENNQASVFCSLTIGYSKIGNKNKAQDCINIAEKLDPECMFLQRARDSLLLLGAE